MSVRLLELSSGFHGQLSGFLGFVNSWALLNCVWWARSAATRVGIAR